MVDPEKQDDPDGRTDEEGTEDPSKSEFPEGTIEKKIYKLYQLM